MDKTNVGMLAAGAMVGMVLGFIAGWASKTSNGGTTWWEKLRTKRRYYVRAFLRGIPNLAVVRDTTSEGYHLISLPLEKNLQTDTYIAKVIKNGQPTLVDVTHPDD